MKNLILTMSLLCSGTAFADNRESRSDVLQALLEQMSDITVGKVSLAAFIAPYMAPPRDERKRESVFHNTCEKNPGGKVLKCELSISSSQVGFMPGPGESFGRSRYQTVYLSYTAEVSPSGIKIIDRNLTGMITN